MNKNRTFLHPLFLIVYKSKKYTYRKPYPIWQTYIRYNKSKKLPSRAYAQEGNKSLTISFPRFLREPGLISRYVSVFTSKAR